MSQIVSFGTLGVVASIVLLVLFMFTMLVRQYRRCPSNRVLVVYGKTRGERAARCLRVNVPSTFTIGVSTNPDIMNNAAERLLGLEDKAVAALEMINGNIRDIIDESGYIEALGRKAASEAINTARVEVAEADKLGSIGQANATREMEVEVAQQTSQAAAGRKQAERDQRIAVAQFEAEGVSGEAGSERAREVAIAEQRAQAVQGAKEAEATRRIRVAALEASAVDGEDQSKASIAASQATLAEREAEASRRGDVALANASWDVLVAQREEDLARLEKSEIARQLIEQKRIQIDADAEADRIRRIAQGEADAVLARYRAEAEGVRNVLEAKVDGYERLIRVCGDRTDLVPALLVIEKLPELVAEQVKAIQNLKIDKITVWDSGAGDGASAGATAGFLRGLISALPPIQ